MIDGLLIEVRADERASAATAAVAVGGTSVPVESLAPFSDDGGRVDIAGTVYDYTGVDTSTVTADGEGGALLLDSALTVAVAEFDPVSELIGSDVAVDFVAVVDLADDDEASTPIEVPLNTREERVAWPVRIYDPPLPVSLSDDQTKIEAAPSAIPQIDLTLGYKPVFTAYIDSDVTIPHATWTTITTWTAFFPPEQMSLGFDGHLQLNVSGRYLILFTATFGASAIGSRALRMRYWDLAGGNFESVDVKVPADGNVSIQNMQLQPFFAGVAVSFEVWQNSGADLTLTGAGTAPKTSAQVIYEGRL